MTKLDLSKATNEDLLRAVIDAQKKGGFEEFDFLAIDTVVLDTGYVNSYVRSRHILEVLLSTEGCKAAFKGLFMCEDCGNGTYDICPDEYCPFHVEAWSIASEHVLYAWHKGAGNNVRNALQMYVSLLPTK